MRRSWDWSRGAGAIGAVVLAAAGLTQVASAEQPLKQLPEDVASFSLAWVALPQAMAEVTKEHGPLAGVSWGVIKGSSDVMGRVVDLLDRGPSFERQAQTVSEPPGLADTDARRPPAWLNAEEGAARQAEREPAFLRYTF